MTLKSKQPRQALPEKVISEGARIPIRKNGRIVAAIVPADDFKLLEEMDRRDVRLARNAMARARAKGEKPIPWSEARKMLDLD